MTFKYHHVILLFYIIIFGNRGLRRLSSWPTLINTSAVWLMSVCSRSKMSGCLKDNLRQYPKYETANSCRRAFGISKIFFVLSARATGAAAPTVH